MKGNKELLIGKWELSYTITYRYDYKRSKYYFSDSTIPGINTNSLFFINFKKSGKVLAEYNGEESKHKMNFGSFDNEKSNVNLFTTNGLQHLGDFYKFKANFYHKGDKEVNVISGAVNDDVLTLDMGWAFFELDNGGSVAQWVFNRVP